LKNVIVVLRVYRHGRTHSGLRVVSRGTSSMELSTLTRAKHSICFKLGLPIPLPISICRRLIRQRSSLGQWTILNMQWA